MKKLNSKTEKRTRRHRRIRAKMFGTAARPRLAVFKSNTAISAQLINDDKGMTVAAAHSKSATGKTLSEKAVAVGKDIATQAKAKKISMAVFDRGGYTYTGNIKAVAEGAREGGLEF